MSSLPVPSPGELTLAGRGVFHVTFSPSRGALVGVRRMLREFLGGYVDAETASGFAQAAADVFRDCVRPGVDDVARVTVELRPDLREATFEVNTSFRVHDGEAARLQRLIHDLGRSTGRFAYVLLADAGASETRSFDVRASGTVATDVDTTREGECVVTTVTRTMLRCTAPRWGGLARLRR